MVRIIEPIRPTALFAAIQCRPSAEIVTMIRAPWESLSESAVSREVAERDNPLAGFQVVDYSRPAGALRAHVTTVLRQLAQSDYKSHPSTFSCTFFS
jgi:hypothetical protein